MKSAFCLVHTFSFFYSYNFCFRLLLFQNKTVAFLNLFRCYYGNMSPLVMFEFCC